METVDILKQLEINYGVIMNDLEFASHELDARMKDYARGNISIPDLHALEHRIRAIKTEMPELAKDAMELQRERTETEAALNAALIENFKVMVGLYARLGVVPDPDWVSAAESVEGLLPSEPRNTTTPDHFSAECEDEIHGDVLHSAAGDGAKGAKSAALRSCGGDINASMASRVKEKIHQHSPSIIFEEDFMAVPPNTRGRCTLQDVRKVYTKVREDFEKKRSRGRPGRSPAPISKRELDAAGLKVFGHTGDCILNTLRAMGLMTVTKGSVAMVSS